MYLFSKDPWRVVKGFDGSISVVSGINTVADVYATSDKFYEEFTQVANADLIALAPEMYSLLEAIHVAISTNNMDKLKRLNDCAQSIFIRAGVTPERRWYRQVNDQATLALAQRQVDDEDRQTEEAEILQEYFGDSWDKYDLFPADVGYRVLSKEDEFEEYFIFGETEGCFKPYYFNSKYWCKHDDSPAYVLPYRKSQRMLSYDQAYTYYYHGIKEDFMNAGIMDPDMKHIAYMLDGRTPRKLILAYKKEYDD